MHLIDSGGMYGAERMVVTLLEEMIASQFPGILGCIREHEDEIPQIAREAQTRGISIQYFTMKRGLNPAGILSVPKYVKENHVSIVHAHGYKPDLFLRFLLRRSIKKIATVHGWAKNTAGLKIKLYEYLDVGALRNMDLVIAVSQSMRSELIKLGLRKDHLETIYNGIKFNFTLHAPQLNISILRNEYGLADNAVVIGTMGRLVAVKGHSYLIQAMPLILKEIPHCQLIIAGDGPLRSRLQDQIADLKIANHVKLMGYIKDITVFFALADIFALPSLSEGLPITLLEAMAFGKPVIASSVGGIPEVLTYESAGELIPPADANTLAQAIITLLKDKGKMNLLSKRNRKLVENQFSAKTMARQYLDMYKRLVAH